MSEIADIGGEWWVIHWKRNGGGEVRDCIGSFGVARSKEEILSRAETAVKAGMTTMWDPTKFAAVFAGGRFYPVELNDFVQVPGHDEEDGRRKIW